MNSNFKKQNILLDINSFSLYLNSVGGHSLFIQISPKYLIKSANENEINFYTSNIKLNNQLPFCFYFFFFIFLFFIILFFFIL